METEKIISDLIRFKTTSEKPEEIKKCADYILDYLNDDNISIETTEIDGKFSIVATYSRTKAPDVFFNAHFDVVPGDEAMFTPRLEGDKLYGRGSEDCKGQVAILLQLIKEFSKVRPSIGLMLTSDEEIGGEKGKTAFGKRLQL